MATTVDSPGTQNTEPLDAQPAPLARFLARTLDAVASSPSISDMARTLAAEIVQTLGNWCAIWLVDRYTGGLQLVAAAHRRPELSHVVHKLVDSWPVATRGDVPSSLVEIAAPILVPLVDEGQMRKVFASTQRAQFRAARGGRVTGVRCQVSGARCWISGSAGREYGEGGERESQ